MLKNKKIFTLSVALSLLLSSFLFLAPASAATTTTGIKSAFSSEGKLGNFAKEVGYNQEPQTPEYYVGLVINITFSLLGVIAVTLIIFNGYKWMTAGGNENKVKEAKGGLTSSILGLLIILASYAVTFFIFNIFT
jgi:hypothetical protein